MTDRLLWPLIEILSRSCSELAPSRSIFSSGSHCLQGGTSLRESRGLVCVCVCVNVCVCVCVCLCVFV